MGRTWSVVLPVCLAFLAGAVLVACSPAPQEQEPADGGHPPAPDAPSPPEEWDRELPADVLLADLYDDETTHVPIRVVNDATGEPIAGARIENWFEAGLPHAEPWDALRVHSVVTDVDGWALADRRTYGQWYFVDAPGWAAASEFPFAEEYRLVPGRDVPIEVRDWLDRPVAGAEVELLLGCGHTPAVRTETTDAQGRFVFHDIDPDAGTMWVRAAGVLGSSGYSTSPGELPLEDGRRILRTWPAPVIEGRVVNGDGSPAVGVAVGVRDTHRGPWTATDADGRFQLLGAPPGEHVEVVYSWPAGVAERSQSFGVAPGTFTGVRLPTPGEEDEPEPETTSVSITATVANEQPIAAEEIPVRAVRQADGRVEADDGSFIDGWLVGELELPPGTWSVTVGSLSGAIRPHTQQVVVGNEPVDVDALLETNPVCRPEVVELGDDGELHALADLLEGEFHILDPLGRWTPTPAGRRNADGNVVPDEGLFHVPAEGPFVVEYRAADSNRTARVVLTAPPVDDGPQLVLPPAVSDADEQDDLEMASIPYEGDFPEETLTVLLPDGSPAAGATLRVSGSQGNVSYSQSMNLDDAGQRVFGFRRHDRVEVDADGVDDVSLPPLVRYIDTPGPWTIRWPSTTVEVRAVDADGAALPELEVTTGAFEGVFSDTGVVRLSGLPAGAVRFWVSASGCLAHDVRVVVAEDETRTVTVVMSPRPTTDE